MSETSATRTGTPARRTSLIIIVAVIFVLALIALGYLGGYFILPGSIQSAYQDKNCGSVLSQYGLYTRVYPVFLQDKRLESRVMECAVYTLAGKEEENGAWPAASHAYQVYLDGYPNGLFVAEVKEHGSATLIALANEQLSAKKYEEAMGSLNLVLSQYANTGSFTDASNIYGEIYQTWGTDLRDAEDFEGAERVFGDFKTWAQTNQKTDSATSAQRELAQTYLAWGVALQSQKKFEEALTKLQLAESTDPEPQSDSGPAAQSSANQARFYSEWGDYLIGQKDFTGALEKYGTAAALSGSTDPTAAQDMIANGYVQWAAGLVAEEDFLGALVLLEFAQERAATDSAKALVESARSELYSAFSKSSGEQAQKAMLDAAQIVCEHQVQPRLPIFGMDQEKIRAGVYGVEGKLSESIAATTPASLYYVACTEEDNRIVETLRLPISTTTFGGGPGVVQIDYNNYQYIWNVVLREIATGKEVKATVLEGAKPAKLIPFNITATTFNYFGPKPDIADLVDWIQTAIQ